MLDLGITQKRLAFCFTNKYITHKICIQSFYNILTAANVTCKTHLKVKQYCQFHSFMQRPFFSHQQKQTI